MLDLYPWNAVAVVDRSSTGLLAALAVILEARRIRK